MADEVSCLKARLLDKETELDVLKKRLAQLEKVWESIESSIVG